MSDSEEIKKIENYKVLAKGSLGLLAYGYKGLVAWRREIAKEKNFTEVADKEIIGPFYKVPNFERGQNKKQDAE